MTALVEYITILFAEKTKQEKTTNCDRQEPPVHSIPDHDIFISAGSCIIIIPPRDKVLTRFSSHA